jgi:Uma2 family endonuclease
MQQRIPSDRQNSPIEASLDLEERDGASLNEALGEEALGEEALGEEALGEDYLDEEILHEKKLAEAALLASLPARPTMYDLPSEDPEEPGLPDEFHDLQPQLLSRTLRLSGYTSQEVYTASDLNLYYDLNHPFWYKRPDWFLVVGVSRLYDGEGKIEGEGDRDSYVIWQENVSPIVVVELLSPGTESDDLGRFVPPSQRQKSSRKQADPTSPPSKFEVYEKILKVPHYIVFNKRGTQLRYFRLIEGAYQEQAIATTNPRLWIAELDIGLAIWRGRFSGMTKSWIRWCDATGTVIPTDTEAALEAEAIAQQRQQQAEREREQAEREREQAERERQQAERGRQQVQSRLRQTVLSLHGMGMSTAQITQITGLTKLEVGAIVGEHG